MMMNDDIKNANRNKPRLNKQINMLPEKRKEKNSSALREKAKTTPKVRNR